MSIADFYESGAQKINKSQLENLISVALTDGLISEQEQQLLAKFARRLSIDNDTFNEMLKGAEKYAINPPFDKEERYKRLFNLVTISMADDVVDEKEHHLLIRYATGLGYPDDRAEELITNTISMIKNGVDFDSAFEKI
jgi:uncharacterized tellurite resistance protein B-like protein